jgi:hypothetical protein
MGLHLYPFDQATVCVFTALEVVLGVCRGCEIHGLLVRLGWMTKDEAFEMRHRRLRLRAAAAPPARADSTRQQVIPYAAWDSAHAAGLPAAR